MDLPTCRPDPDGLRLTTTASPHVIWLDVERRACRALCPRCKTLSTRRHRGYTRILKDLPLLGFRVRWHLSVRTFFCDVQDCSQRIFCERLPEVTAPWHRATLQLEAQQRIAAFEAGAESAARILAAVGSTASPNTLLARLRRAPPPSNPSPVRFLGIDDLWSEPKTHGSLQFTAPPLFRMGNVV